jgi:hypothetical protein
LRFSAAASIEISASDDWFDPVLEQDSPLYIDPYLIFQDDDPQWSGAYDQIVQFFETATELVLAAGGAPDTPAWRKASRFLRFPEPHEFALGVALGSPRGSGTGEKFAKRMAEVLALVGTSGIDRLASISGFALFCKGIGVDRISDIVGNILKDRFIEYTHRVLEGRQVQVELVPVEHASWDAGRARWNNSKVALLPNPATKGGVLLTPRRFLRDIPVLEPEDFWDWASLSESQSLRDDLNFDLSESLTASQKVARARIVARARPDIALTFLDRVSDQTMVAYDSRQDPRGLVGWYEGGVEALNLVPESSRSSQAPSGPDDFASWILELAKDFQFVIENTDAWRLLWNDRRTEHRPEKIAQALAGVMWRSRCKSANVDLSKETNIGRGPVDFKFSQGWERRGLLEMKYVESSHFTQGAERQLPQYLRSEEVSFGVYLAVGFKDSDFERPRVRRVEEACSAIGEQLGCRIELLLVDARPKASASNL